MRTPVNVSLYSPKHPLPSGLFADWREFCARSQPLLAFLRQCANAAHLPQSLDLTVITTIKADGEPFVIPDADFAALDVEHQATRKSQWGVPCLSVDITFDLAGLIDQFPDAPERVKGFCLSPTARHLIQPLARKYEIGDHKRSVVTVQTNPPTGQGDPAISSRDHVQLWPIPNPKER